MRAQYAIVIAAAALAASPAWAQVEQVTVTATAPLPPVGQAAFSTVTLDSSVLSSSDRLDDAMEDVPGLSLFRRSSSLNANATTQGVSLRAIAPSGAGRALVLLDGVPMNDPFGGWVIWSALPWEDLASAEVVRGAGAGPYGAGALTGTISLDERSDTGGVSVADLSGGSLGTYRAGAADGMSLGKVEVFASASGERSDGWIPVLPPDRGAADNHLWLDAGSASVRADTEFDGILASARIGGYDEARGGGTSYVNSSADGLNESITLERPAEADRFGWRLQAYSIESGFTNTSASIASARAFTTPANDQYATPALGIGGNAAAAGSIGDFRWEVGGDVRRNSGESRELYFWGGTAFNNRRRSGGQQIVAGLYAEGAYDTGDWLLTAGARGDYWADAQGHLVQTVRTTGALLSEADYPGRNGVVPTGRAGVRRNFDGFYVRAAAYAGFRPPSLNELYRPFRVGNNTTNANAALVPEKLYGTELGLGQDKGAFTWDADVFWNQLADAIANVTISSSTSGTVYQRQNAGDIDAVGAEGEAQLRLSDTLRLQGAFSVTDARVHPGAAAAQLAGKRPAQAPRMTLTGGVSWRPMDRLSLDADLRFEGKRFEDDLNTLTLGAAFKLDLRAAWRLRDSLSAYVAVDNATDADIATAEATNFVYSYDAPRTFEVGLTYAP